MADPATHPDGQFLSLGELLLDLIATDGATRLEDADHFIARAGGAPANASVALATLGLPAAFMGKVGTDPIGNRLTEELAERGVDISRVVRTDEAATTLAFAWKDARGDGNFYLLRNADTLLTPEDVEGAGIDRLGALLMCSISLSGQPSRAATWRAARIARDAGVPVVFDINVRPLLWKDPTEILPACLPVLECATIVKLSLDDAAALFGETLGHDDAVRRTMALCPDASVVLTDGARGAWFAPSGREDVVHVPPFAVDAVEPTGAGDAFTAALARRLGAGGWQPPTVEDVRHAAAAGALATTKPGAWDGLPTAAELDAFIASR